MGSAPPLSPVPLPLPSGRVCPTPPQRLRAPPGHAQCWGGARGGRKWRRQRPGGTGTGTGTGQGRTGSGGARGAAGLRARQVCRPSCPSPRPAAALHTGYAPRTEFSAQCSTALEVHSGHWVNRKGSFVGNTPVLMVLVLKISASCNWWWLSEAISSYPVQCGLCRVALSSWGCCFVAEVLLK